MNINRVHSKLISGTSSIITRIVKWFSCGGLILYMRNDAAGIKLLRNVNQCKVVASRVVMVTVSSGFSLLVVLSVSVQHLSRITCHSCGIWLMITWVCWDLSLPPTLCYACGLSLSVEVCFHIGCYVCAEVGTKSSFIAQLNISNSFVVSFLLMFLLKF